MPPKLRVEFDEPSDGWLAITLQSNGREFSDNVSHIYPTLRDLCCALCDVWVGRPSRRVVFRLEPEELELNLASLHDGRCSLSLREFADRRRTSESGSVVFEFDGDVTQIVLSFWRALRRLQTALAESEFGERWEDQFPNLEMASLTELVAKEKSPAAAPGKRPMAR